MNKLLLLLFLSILLTSCSHQIRRIDYTVTPTENINCDIAIRKKAIIGDSMVKVGEIKLSDGGISTSCSEEHALKILKKEGCSLDADLVNIIYEARPDVLSSCYRCYAEFYRSDGNIPLLTDPDLTKGEVLTRVDKDRKRNVLIYSGAAVLGFALGLLIF